MKISKNDLLKKIKQNVLALEPDAEIILYGSRARGDFSPDSDWDLLVLLNGKVNRQRKEKIYDSFYKVELNNNEILSPHIKEKMFWNSDLHKATALHKNAVRDGIRI